LAFGLPGHRAIETPLKLKRAFDIFENQVQAWICNAKLAA
jgi:hypothetical protein